MKVSYMVRELLLFQARIDRLTKSAMMLGVPVLLITNPLDVAYFTGFLGGDSYLLLGRGRPKLLSDFRYQEELAEVSSLAEIIIRKGTMGAVVLEQLSGSKECGVQAESMTVAERNQLAAGLADIKGKGGCKIIETSGLVSAMRAVKDASEVALIKAAAKIQQQALLAVLPELKPGISELEVAAMIESEMKRRGSSAPGFQTIVAAQPNGSLPHHRPGRAKLKANKTVLIDWGAIYKGYHSDMTRVYALGKWPKKIAEIYAIALDAKEAAAAALAPGRTTREIDGLARDYIAKHGYGEFFGHGLGHGLGLNGHEDPRVTNMQTETPLIAGHVLTIEPGIYLPGVGGVRIEDDYVITERGATNLCSLPQSIDACTL